MEKEIKEAILAKTGVEIDPFLMMLLDEAIERSVNLKLTLDGVEIPVDLQGHVLRSIENWKSAFQSWRSNYEVSPNSNLVYRDFEVRETAGRWSELQLLLDQLIDRC